MVSATIALILLVHDTTHPALPYMAQGPGAELERGREGVFKFFPPPVRRVRRRAGVRRGLTLQIPSYIGHKSLVSEMT